MPVIFFSLCNNLQVLFVIVENCLSYEKIYRNPFIQLYFHNQFCTNRCRLPDLR